MRPSWVQTRTMNFRVDFFHSQCTRVHMTITLQSIIILCVIGLIAGFLAGLIWKGRGLGFLGNLIVGIAGSFLGYLLVTLFKLRIVIISPLITQISVAVVGALILLFVLNLFKR